MIAALLLLPALAGLAAFRVRAHRRRRLLLVAATAGHAALTAAAWFTTPAPALGGWLALDATGLLFLSVTSVVFLAASVHIAHSLAREAPGAGAGPFRTSIIARHQPEAVFTACILLLLATMTLVTVSEHFGLLWVAIEGTTLASAPLISYQRSSQSLEATWKYLLVCSVGIALALLGIFFLAASGANGHGSTSLLAADLLANAGSFETSWLKAAFLFVVVGYGTKMGLAPLHTWLPDAYSESPSGVSALLSGALSSTAFLGILRMREVAAAAGLAPFAHEVLLGFGLVSMAVAACFLYGQSDYKRMLAYSSVEHMGILAVGAGIGGVGVYGALLHVVNHSLAKGLLFLVSGNILWAYRTKSIAGVQGLVRSLPASGTLWLVGFCAIVGSPPFGSFLSEFTILKAAFDRGSYLVAATFIVLVVAAFVGIAGSILSMTQGAPTLASASAKERALSILPPAFLAAGVLVLGFYVPPFLCDVLERAAGIAGAAP